MIVLVPAPVSVMVVRDEPLRLFIIAINNTITIIPPTTQTQGMVYHSLCSVVVVVTVLLVDALSWLQQIIVKQLNNKVTIKYLKKLVAEKFFICDLFG